MWFHFNITTDVEKTLQLDKYKTRAMKVHIIVAAVGPNYKYLSEYLPGMFSLGIRLLSGGVDFFFTKCPLRKTLMYIYSVYNHNFT